MASRKRSGWVPGDARHTVQLYVRCSPELATRARAVAEERGRTLAEILEAGVRALEATPPLPVVSTATALAEERAARADHDYERDR